MMGLLTFLLMLLIYALVAYVVIYVILAILGLFFQVPAKVPQILYAIAGLIILIWALQHLPALPIP